MGEDFYYKKNSLEMYDLLKGFGRMEKALQNAKRLTEKVEGREDYANQNPCTTVWKLVEELIELK